MSEKNKNIALATAKSIKTSMTKVNLVLKMIRGKRAENALNILAFSKKRISNEITKILKSAIANAENNHQLDIDKLIVKEATVGKSMVLKRFRPRARGRSGKILKPFSKVKPTRLLTCVCPTPSIAYSIGSSTVKMFLV